LGRQGDGSPLTELADDKEVPGALTGQELCAFLPADSLSELKRFIAGRSD